MKIQRLRSGFKAVLSPLEEDVLTVLWPDKKMRVKDIYKSLRKNKKPVVLCSVAVILDRLHSRDIVSREVETARGGVRYVYFPKKNQREFEESVIATTVDRLIEQFGSTAVSYFNGRFKR